MCLLAKIAWPTANAANDAASPARKATAVNTPALAASTLIRCGGAAKVERIEPVAYFAGHDEHAQHANRKLRKEEAA